MMGCNVQQYIVERAAYDEAQRRAAPNVAVAALRNEDGKPVHLRTDRLPAGRATGPTVRINRGNAVLGVAGLVTLIATVGLFSAGAAEYSGQQSVGFALFGAGGALLLPGVAMTLSSRARAPVEVREGRSDVVYLP